MYRDALKTQNGKQGLFNIEEVVWKRLLKRLWSVILLEVQNKQDVYNYQGK